VLSKVVISEYSPVRHYATSVFPFSDRQKWIVVMADLYHVAYMDETGHAADGSQKFCGMAGFLAPAYKWERFESNWNAVLNEFHIPYFHMKEYAHSKGVFKGWEKDEGKRQELFNKLLNKIAAIRAVPTGSITSLEGFRRLSREDQLAWHDPYLRSLLDCTSAAGFLLDDQPPQVKFAVVFSQQSEFRHRAEHVYQLIGEASPFGNRMLYPDFKDMRDLVPLQAADIIAYELHREFERRLHRPHARPRHGYTRIVEMASRVLPTSVLPLVFAFHDETAIRKFCADMKAHFAKMGMDSPDYTKGWKWLYQRPLARAAKKGKK
jgi:uncharacterized protein DUF3800